MDEDLASKSLLRSLADLEGVDVVPPERESTDEDVWGRAQTEGAALLTQNAKDFATTAKRQPDHAGLLLLSRRNQPGDPTVRDIARAVAAIREAYPDGIAEMTLSVNGFLRERRT